MRTLAAVLWFVQGMVDVVLLWGLGATGGKVEDLRWRIDGLEARRGGRP